MTRVSRLRELFHRFANEVKRPVSEAEIAAFILKEDPGLRREGQSMAAFRSEIHRALETDFFIDPKFGRVHRNLHVRVGKDDPLAKGVSGIIGSPGAEQ